MKLPNQTHGPVTLTRIDYAANLSEETYAFTAMLSIVVDGKTLHAAVRNEGHGGDNWIHNDAVRAAVNVYAATLPPLAFESGADGSEPLAYDYDLLISEMVGDAIAAHDLKKALKRKVLVEDSGRIFECMGPLTPGLAARMMMDRPAARVLNTMPFDEALALYRGAP